MNIIKKIDKILFILWTSLVPIIIATQCLLVFVGFFKEWNMDYNNVVVLSVVIIVYLACILFNCILGGIAFLHDAIMFRKFKNRIERERNNQHGKETD